MSRQDATVTENKPVTLDAGHTNSPVTYSVIHPPDKGRKIVFDNVDWHMNVHHMSETNQNVSTHYTVKMSVSNRVNSNHFYSILFFSSIPLYLF